MLEIFLIFSKNAKFLKNMKIMSLKVVKITKMH
jgi:hypothetical protein